MLNHALSLPWNHCAADAGCTIVEGPEETGGAMGNGAAMATGRSAHDVKAQRSAGGAEGEQGEMGSADTAPVPRGEPGQSGLQGEAAAPVSAERSDNSSIAQCRCALLFASAAVHTGIDVHHTPKKTNRISEINLCFVLYEGKKSQQISTATNAAIHAAIA